MKKSKITTSFLIFIFILRFGLKHLPNLNAFIKLCIFSLNLIVCSFWETFWTPAQVRRLICVYALTCLLSLSASTGITSPSVFIHKTQMQRSSLLQKSSRGLPCVLHALWSSFFTGLTSLWPLNLAIDWWGFRCSSQKESRQIRQDFTALNVRSPQTSHGIAPLSPQKRSMLGNLVWRNSRRRASMASLTEGLVATGSWQRGHSGSDMLMCLSRQPLQKVCPQEVETGYVSRFLQMGQWRWREIFTAVAIVVVSTGKLEGGPKSCNNINNNSWNSNYGPKQRRGNVMS